MLVFKKLAEWIFKAISFVCFCFFTIRSKISLFKLAPSISLHSNFMFVRFLCCVFSFKRRRLRFSFLFYSKHFLFACLSEYFLSVLFLYFLKKSLIARLKNDKMIEYKSAYNFGFKGSKWLTRKKEYKMAKFNGFAKHCNNNQSVEMISVTKHRWPLLISFVLEASNHWLNTTKI